MNYQKYRQTISKLSPDTPVYLLEGGKRGYESFFRDRIIARLKNLMFEEGDRSMMNIDSFYAPDDPARTACDAARSVPFFGGKNMVVIYNVDRYREPDQRALEAYLANPNRHCVMIITGRKFDRRKKFYKTAKSSAEVIPIEPPYDSQIPEYINAYVRSEKKQISPEAVEILLENVGPDLGRIIMEIDKLIIYVGDQQSISADCVDELIGFSREETNFNLCEAVLEQNTDEALKILSVLRQEGVSLQEIIGMLRWQLERLWRGHDLINEGSGSDQIIRELGIHPRFVPAFIASVRKYPVGIMRRGYQQVLEADWASRQAGADPDTILDVLVVELCRN